MQSLNNNAKLLIIAGSDPSGGAGIQGDIKTAHQHGVYASAAITALTAQNTQEVSGIFDVSANFVAEQIRLVLEDIGTDAIKIGMLNNAGVIAAVESMIGGRNIPIVLDTVMVAKGGAPLLRENSIQALKTRLIPMATLVTPNLPEAEILAGMKIQKLEDMVQAGKIILGLGCEAVLVKGGHLKSPAVYDVLLTRQKYDIFTHDRVNSRHTHGTGCMLATAIACHLARCTDLLTAVERAQAFVINAIKTAPQIGNGNGPLNHFVKP